MNRGPAERYVRAYTRRRHERDDGWDPMEQALVMTLIDYRPRRRHTMKSEKRQKSAMFSIRLTPDELNKVQQAAYDRGMSVSAFIRSRALADEHNYIYGANGINGVAR